MSDPYGPNTAIVRRFLQRLAGKPGTDCAAAARVYLSLQGTRALIAADGIWSPLRSLPS